MSLLIQCFCLALIVAAILLNRSQIGNPNYPLLIIGIAGAVWLMVGLYVIGGYLWMATQKQLVLSVLPLRAYINIVLAIMFFSLVVVFILSTQRFPPIHDITTDTHTPPIFSYADKLRHPKHNSLEYDDAIAPQQKQAYPYIQSLTVDTNIHALQITIPKVVESQGWQLHQQYSVDNVSYFEAFERSQVLGFVDDVIIRIQPLGEEGNYQVDMRSVSRIGVSDLGANAKRIQQFLQALAEALGRAEGV